MPDPEILTRKDPLTGFHTKEALLEYLNTKVTSLYSPTKNLSVLIMDLDNFKGINDTYGHVVGDDAIRFFATAINAALKGQHFVARYGGDEFIIVVNDSLDGKEGLDVANRVKLCLGQERFKVPGGSIQIKSSIGISNYPHDAKTTKDLLVAADQALYYVKKHGRNRIAKARHLKRYSFVDKGVLALKLLLAAAVIGVLFLSYLGSGVLKNLIAYWQNNQYFALYQVHSNLQGSHQYQLVLKGDRRISGWVIAENSEEYVLCLVKPKMKLNPFSSDFAAHLQPIKIPKSMVESVAKQSDG